MLHTPAKPLFLVFLLVLGLGIASIVSAQETNLTTATSDQFSLNSDQSAQSDQNTEPPGTTETGTQKPAEVALPSFSYKDTKETTLGRSLVLSIGFFPFTYFYTGFVMDISRFVAHNFSTSYAPWPFKTQYSVALTDSEIWTKFGIATVTSLLFGFLGTIIK